jgi:hypothetical protein
MAYHQKSKLRITILNYHHKLGTVAMKEIILRLGSGSLTTGFPSVNIELRQHHHNKTQNCWEATTSLPPAPQLNDIYQKWQFLYQTSLQHPPQRGVKFAPATITNYGTQDIQQIIDSLTTALNTWLNQGNFHQQIQAQLRTELHPTDRITIAIVTEDLLIWQLPWHRWDFFAAYHNCVEFFSKPQFKNHPDRQPQPNGQVDILAIWGNAPELNLTQDLAALQQPQAHIKSCQPQSALDISNLLATQQLDILFFGGHGETIELALTSGQKTLGTIYLDKNTPIPISKIKQDLQQTADRGLQIAIFNCCSGLGLAAELADLNLPYLIVMRSQISDQLAQQFCRDLLQRYSQGQPFTSAFQYARERLKPASDRLDEFESWLPMLLHNPNSKHVTWQQICRSWWHLPIPPAVASTSQWLTRPQNLPLTWLGVTLLSTGFTLGAGLLPPLKNLENLVLDRFQAAQMAISPSTTHTVIVDVNPKNDPSDRKIVPIIPGGKILASGEILAGLEKIPSIAVGVDIAIADDLPDKSLYLNCTEQPPKMQYLSKIDQDCPALAWTVTKKYLHQTDRAITPHRFTVNPYIAKNIPIISLNKIKQNSNPSLFKDKILIVGFIPKAPATDKSLPPVVIQAIATEQIMQKNVPTELFPAAILILLWSGFSSSAIFQQKWLPFIFAIMVLLSLNLGFLLFINGVLVPSVLIIATISASSILIGLIKVSNN